MDQYNATQAEQMAQAQAAAWAHMQAQAGNTATQAFPTMQQQGQPMMQPAMVLTGKPVQVANAMQLGGNIYYQAALPQQVGMTNMPNGTTQPVMLTAAHVPGAVPNGAAGFPQLQGATAYPAGMMLQQSIPGQLAPAQLQAMRAGGYTLQPIPMPILQPHSVAIKQDSDDRPSSSHSANTSAGGIGSEGGDGSPQVGINKSQYRGVSYDRKKAKWRVQIKVAALGKSGVSVGYFDTEEAAARAYDRAAIGLLGRDNPNLQTNFELDDYSGEQIPRLTGKSREEVKTTLKSERIKQAPRRRFTSRQRTSRFMGVGSSNRKNQWQARILVHGKVTHLGYYETEEEAARVYDRVSLALHGDHAQTNFPSTNYSDEELRPFRGLDREDLQRALGVKPMDKSSQYRGVSKKKGKWEAKVMVNRRWAYRELFDSEEEAARAYDRALWRLKPREARSYVNFKDEVPAGLELESLGGAPGTFRAAGDAQEDSEELVDDGSGDDFQYEYRPTKGTRRSASMRAKRAGSAPNLAAQAAATAAKEQEKQQRQQQKQAAAAVKAEAEDNEDGGLVYGGPSFVPMAGGELQLNLGGGDLGGMPHVVSAGSGMIPNPGSDEPLLVRVGSETHFLPPSSGAHSLLGKRTGMQRIQSEPQFHVTSREQDLLAGPSGPSAGDIHDLMNDHDLFKDLLGEDGGASDAFTFELMGHGANGGEGDDSANQAMQQGKQHSLGALSGLFFEDEEAALASLEFSRPRKMTKSMSMSQLSSLVNNSEPDLLPVAAAAAGQKTSDGTTDGSGNDGSKSLSPSGSDGSGGNKLGPLGQPIRRINTFTSSLPTFAEGDEHKDGDLGALMSPRMAKLTMMSNHSSEDDLFKRLMDPNLSMGSEDPMRMLNEELDAHAG